MEPPFFIVNRKSVEAGDRIQEAENLKDQPGFLASLRMTSPCPSCFLFPVSCFLFPVSCFLFPVSSLQSPCPSCFLSPVSCRLCLPLTVHRLRLCSSSLPVSSLQSPCPSCLQSPVSLPFLFPVSSLQFPVAFVHRLPFTLLGFHDSRPLPLTASLIHSHSGLPAFHVTKP